MSEDDADPMIGRTIGDRYEILEPIGAGGMGAVYLARQVAMDRDVAIKVLHRQFLRDESSRKRFVREMQATSAISHPNTVTVYDYGTTDQEEAYLVMELLSGKTLHQAIVESGPMPTARVAHITQQISHALANAHDKGIVHRDIKPENIMLLDSYGVADWVKVLDFGIARIGESDGDFGRESLTQTGTVLGTPSYMSPERAMGKEMDHRSDIYAVGVLMYVMATGRTPFEGAEPMSVLFKHVSEPVPSLADKTTQEHPAWMDTLIGRLMAKEPDDRPDSLHEVVRILDRHKTSTMPTLPATGVDPGANSDNDTTVVPVRVTQDASPESPDPKAAAPHPLPKARTIIKPSSGYARKPTLPRMTASVPKLEPEPVVEPEPEPEPEPVPVPEARLQTESTRSVEQEPERPRREPAPPPPPPPPPSLGKKLMRLTSALAIVGAATAATIWLLGEMLSGGNPNLSQHANRPSASGPPIRVGILSSLSGSLKAQGVPISEAVKLAIGELNHDGGVLGRTLDAFSADGHSDPEHFKMEAQRLIAEEQVVAIFGCWSSPARKAVKTVVEDHDNLLLYPAAHEGLESSAHITYFGATPNQSMLPAVKWAYAELEARRFLLVGTDSLYSKAASAIIRDAVKKMGGKLVGEVSIAPTSADMSKLTPILDRKKPDVILNTLIGASNAALFAALSDRADADAPRVISFNITERDLTSMSIKRLQGHYLAGTYFQLIERGTNMDFLKKFRTKYGSERIVTPAMAAAYVSVYMWAEAATQAKSAKPEDVRPALLGLTFDAPGGKTTIDAKTGHRSNYARIIRIEPKGQLKLVYASVEALAPEPFPSSRKESAWRTFVERLHTDWANQWAAPRSP